MRTVYLLRHGDYENPQHILPTRLPGFPLSQLGCKQIVDIARYLADKKVRGIYASPILRTKQTARILAGILHLPVIYSKSLLEVDSPIQGQKVSITKDIDRCGDTYHYPLHNRNGGETSEHVYRRMRRIARRAMNEEKGCLVIIGHGDPLMVFSIREQGKPLDEDHRINDYGHYIPKGGLMRLDYEGDTLQRVTRINY